MNTPGDRDGSMKECLGKNCPDPCCTDSPAFLYDEKNPPSITPEESTIAGIDFPFTIQSPHFTYYTEVDVNEWLPNQDKMLKRGVLTQRANIIDLRSLGTKARCGMFIKECLGAEGCKLSDIKPIICKTYPFAVDQGATEIVKILRCPAHKEIISNEENIKRVLLVRKEAGYKDNYVYIGKVLNFLHAHGINPQRNFLKDAEFMSKLVER